MSGAVSGVAISDGRHDVLLKWHMLKDESARPSHSRQSLKRGLKRGALLEIDLQLTGDGHWVCLHDDELDRETTGFGPVIERSRAEIEQLYQRDPAGQPQDDQVLLFNECMSLVRGYEFGRIQIDLKSQAHEIGDLAVQRFANAVDGVGGRLDIGGHDWRAVKRLADTTPGMMPGYDPCDVLLQEDDPNPHDWLPMTLDTAPEAKVIYLHQKLVSRAFALDIDPIVYLSERGKAVDCWRVEPGQEGLVPLLDRLVASGCRQITTNNPFEIERLWLSRH